MSKKYEDLRKQEFDRLTVISMTDKRTAAGRRLWRCKCKCGNYHLACSMCLKRGQVRSCGCKNAETAPKRHYLHGHCLAGKVSPTYAAFFDLRSRFDRPTHHSYARYVERGIRLCAGLRYFEGFLAVVGVRPDRTVIGRVDKDGHFACGRCEECVREGWPLNCRWVPKTTRRGERHAKV